MSGRFLLDTNTVSYATSGRSAAALQRIAEQPSGSILISSISYAEIWYGLKRRPGATKLAKATMALFAEAEIVPWSASTADIYASTRAEMERLGRSLAPLDMLIAAHALEADATLVTSDRAFRFLPGLRVEDWTIG
ncbi:tRNA(fMet)-specific endonuclease VapC [Mesorhizobium sp. J18]|uniref:type II toxin-antitoxin system VapC family toxin n=1 Tax=Mesorhizobium sp. J18 TaxID=935263 RepID=UPI00119C6AD9|nr:type II toxin-antitoxin system VapC family toxin [Mesorhizobium sp. J18]TWG99735.1 tRNA(fMet)-specific endonuclease VapC [Mesorhizobium sp. J18]